MRGIHPRASAGLSTVVVLALFAAACGTPPAAPPAADPASARSLPAGDVVGVSGLYGGHVWLGLPYAAPPVGPRRWRAPEPAERWSGLREAIALGSPCPQRATRFAGVDTAPDGAAVGDEDCLTLNVYAPERAREAIDVGAEGLPVMVWIHGGGNVVGHGGLYEGSHLATHESIVVVTLNYRLGPLGWFRHAALREDAASDAERSGNFGTLDLIRALEWVRDNIAAFGGDPERVTIFGESAGGRDVFSLLVSPLARGLFHRAISQSGRAELLPPVQGERRTVTERGGVTGHRNASAEILLRLLVADGTATDREAAHAQVARMGAPAIADYLRAVPADVLQAAYVTGTTEGLIDVPQLFADGHVLPAGAMIDTLADPNGYNAVPAIFGTNRDENKIFMFANPKWTRQIFGVYPQLRDGDLFDATAEALARAWKVGGADRPAAAIAQHGASPVWVYRWDWDEETPVFGANLSRMIGAGHGVEIPFVFGHFEFGALTPVFDDDNASGRTTLSAQMMSYWAEFARAGDPGRGGDGALPVWSPWPRDAARAASFVILDTAADGGLRMESGVTTPEAIVADILTDGRLDTDEKRCELVYEVAEFLVSRSGDSPAPRYSALAGDACNDHPPSAFAEAD